MISNTFIKLTKSTLNFVKFYTTDSYMLTQPLIEFRKKVKEYVNEELEPKADKADKDGSFQPDHFQKMGKANLLGVKVPVKYGGLGLGDFGSVILSEELAKGCGATATSISGHTSLFTGSMIEYGTEDQIAQFIPQHMSGEYVGSFSLSEPSNGSDAAGLTTTAKLDGDSWVINGSKMWITNGSLPGAMVLIASTDRNKLHKGLNSFIVPKPLKNAFTGKVEDKLGMKASPTCQISFESARIPAENVLGKPGHGFKMAMEALNSARLGAASIGLGNAQASIDLAYKFLKRKNIYPISSADCPIGALKLAEMECRTQAARLMIYTAAKLMDNKHPDRTKYCAMAKVMGSETGTYCAHEAMQIMGDEGYLVKNRVERLYRDNRVTEIFDGTSEIQRLVIAKSFEQSS